MVIHVCYILQHLVLGLLFIFLHILSFYCTESENFTSARQLDHFNASGNSKSFYVHASNASNFTNKPMSNKTMTANDTQEYLTEQRSDVTKDYLTKQISDRAKDYLTNQRLNNGSGLTSTEMIRDNITSKRDGITQANVVVTVQNKVAESSQNERNKTMNGVTTGKMVAEGSGGKIEMSSSVILLTTGKKVETRDGMTSASSTAATTTLMKPESESDGNTTNLITLQQFLMFLFVRLNGVKKLSLQYIGIVRAQNLYSIIFRFP